MPALSLRHRFVLLFAGGGVLGLLLPLHELSERLFSVHMVEHEIMMAVAAPLIVLAGPVVLLLRLVPQPARRRIARWGAAPLVRHAWLYATGPIVAWSVHTLALWLWHMPLLFETALHDDVVHDLQHLSFLAAGLLYWSSLIAKRHEDAGYGVAVLSLFATAMQCGLLGALLTLASVPWYSEYPEIDDQQLAGLVMWVPAGIVYTGAALVFLVAWLRESERRTRRWERTAVR